jgi:predicted RNA-binding Zn-ribbon protein involved in translation (DUF1610 family)
LKIPPEFEPEMPENIRRSLWKDEGRNDRERLRNWREAEKRRRTHDAKRRKRRAESKRQYGQQHRGDIKREALEHYSSDGVIKCSRCGFNDIRAFTLYNPNKDMEESARSGWNQYDWLEKQGWPKGYRVLCENCLFIESGRGSTYPLKIEAFKRYPLPEDGRIKYVCPKCKHVILVPEIIKCPKCDEPLLHQVQCVQCGFDDMRALSLDHVEGGGRKQMEKLGIRKASEWYQWLKDNFYPQKPKLQVLCMNCQTIKERETHEWA